MVVLLIQQSLDIVFVMQPIPQTQLVAALPLALWEENKMMVPLFPQILMNAGRLQMLMMKLTYLMVV